MHTPAVTSQAQGMRCHVRTTRRPARGEGRSCRPAAGSWSARAERGGTSAEPEARAPCGVRRPQVANWFVNARKRVWKPMKLAADPDFPPDPPPPAYPEPPPFRPPPPPPPAAGDCHLLPAARPPSSFWRP